MGFAFRDACYATAKGAADAACAEHVFVYNSGSTVYTNTCTSATAANPSTLSIRRAQAGSNTITNQTITMQFPVCDEMERVLDLSTLWITLVGAGIVIWLAKNWMYKLLANQ
jgi:hypothetical protein